MIDGKPPDYGSFLDEELQEALSHFMNVDPDRAPEYLIDEDAFEGVMKELGERDLREAFGDHLRAAESAGLDASNLRTRVVAALRAFGG